MSVPNRGCVFISVRDKDKKVCAELASRLSALGFTLIATGGTAKYLRERELSVKRVNKVLQGRPHCVDAIIDGKVQLVINTTEGARAVEDSYSIRRSALINNIPHYTTITGSSAAVAAIEAIIDGGLEVAPLQSYLKTTP